MAENTPEIQQPNPETCCDWKTFAFPIGLKGNFENKGAWAVKLQVGISLLNH